MDEAAALPTLAPGTSNVPEYTVSEISGAVKRTLEGNFGRVRVRGEITEMKRYPSGHIYFSLKDEGAKLSGIVWKSAVSRLGMVPENGVEVIATGRVSAYGERSSYQLIVERMDYAGAGALLARIEALRLRLAAEGLFDAGRKRTLPMLPRVIGVVTSAQGAVIQDIRTTILRRFPRPILIWPVPVQGEGAAARIAAAIRGFDALDGTGAVPRPDVLIVARGGGSLEDLMAFNDEAVLRAASDCRIPLISAVGHETDTTLIDFVSDRRAPTPTAAAEMAIPARADLLADLSQKTTRLLGGLNRKLQEQRLRLSRAERGLPDPAALLGAARQRLDDRGERLRLALPNLLADRRARLATIERRLPDLPAILAARRAALGLAGAHLGSGLRHFVAGKRQRSGRTLERLNAAPLQAMLRHAATRLEGTAARLEAVSPLAILARGYALVQTPAGKPFTAAAAISPGQRLVLRFADGTVGATADGGTMPSRQGKLL
jgi:exodeoxyribonuclease VII large subunit